MALTGLKWSATLYRQFFYKENEKANQLKDWDAKLEVLKRDSSAAEFQTKRFDIRPIFSNGPFLFSGAGSNQSDENEK